jgi:hypothetical protein
VHPSDALAEYTENPFSYVCHMVGIWLLRLPPAPSSQSLGAGDVWERKPTQRLRQGNARTVPGAYAAGHFTASAEDDYLVQNELAKTGFAFWLMVFELVTSEGVDPWSEPADLHASRGQGHNNGAGRKYHERRGEPLCRSRVLVSVEHDGHEIWESDLDEFGMSCQDAENLQRGRACPSCGGWHVPPKTGGRHRSECAGCRGVTAETATDVEIAALIETVQALELTYR